jgi:hypothetical protein
MSKNVIGLAGLAIAIVDALSIASTPTTSQTRVLIQLAGALIVVVLGAIATKRGSRGWLFLSGSGLLIGAFLIFAVVGP